MDSTLKTRLLDFVPLSDNIRQSLENLYFRVGARRCLARKTLKKKQPVVLLTMGKVGSSTVWRRLNAANLQDGYVIFRGHFLTPRGNQFFRSVIEAGYGGRHRLPNKAKRMIAGNEALSHAFAHHLSSSRLKVVTVVRDPVATNLSGFFQNHFWWPKHLLDACHSGAPAIAEPLRHVFMNNYPHNLPVKWFDYELLSLAPLAKNGFPHERGYQILSGPYVDVLVLRLENLNDVFNLALSEFLGIPITTHDSANLATDKWYSDVYKSFLNRMKLPESYLNKLYSHQCVRYFYSDSEIASFMERWTVGSEHNLFPKG